MIKTTEINVDLTAPKKELKYVTTKTVAAKVSTVEEDKERIKNRKPKKGVSTSDIDWKKREKLEKLAKARLVAKAKRDKKKT